MALAGIVQETLKPLRTRFAQRSIPRGILDARVTHVRHHPKRYALSQRLWYLHAGLDDLEQLPGLLLGYNRGLYSIADRDHGDPANRTQPLKLWIADVMRECGARVPPDCRISLLTLPRAIGFSFNPVSFWFWRDAQGGLRAVLAEVNNTFGERHCYLCCKEDGSPITARDQMAAQKVFHVSPFLPVKGSYVFRFAGEGDRLGVFINLFHGELPVLFVSITGRLRPLSSWAVFVRALTAPLPAPAVVVSIHYHAARLYLRGIGLFAKPPPSEPRITKSLVLTSPARERTPS